MIIRTPSFQSIRKEIKLKFVTDKGEYEKSYKISFQGMQGKNFYYEVEDGFPREMVRLLFGADAVVVK